MDSKFPEKTISTANKNLLILVMKYIVGEAFQDDASLFEYFAGVLSSVVALCAYDPLNANAGDKHGAGPARLHGAV